MSILLDAAEYTAAWRPHGEKPTVLHTPDHGDTLAARDALDTRAWARLAARGLARDHAAEPALDDLLAVLAGPDVEVGVRWWAGGPADAVRRTAVAARGDHGVAAELDDAGGLRLDPVDPGDLAAALLTRLPAEAPWPGAPVSVPADAIGAADPVERAGRLRRAGVPRPTMDRLTAMWSAPPRRVLQFCVAARSRDGGRLSGDPLDVVDAEPGRLALLRDPSGHLTLRPATPAWLRAELDARRADLHG